MHDGCVGDRAAKDALFEGFGEVAKALASGRRAEIVDVLAQGDRSVEEVSAEIGQSVANTSHHLRALARAGLLTTRRDGTRIYYALASDRVAELWAAVRDVAEAHGAGLEKLAAAYLGDRDGIEVVDRAELAARLRDGAVVVLDVRPEPEFRAGHIAGARSVPIAELRRHLARPAEGQRCRGLLPWSLLRVRRRCGTRAQPQGLQGSPPDRRLPGMEASRAPRRQRRRRPRRRLSTHPDNHTRQGRHLMAAQLGLVLDCADPERLAPSGQKRSATRPSAAPGTTSCSSTRPEQQPKLLLQQVSEPKAGKNRMHFDIETPTVDEEVSRLEGLGARRLGTDAIEEHGTRWVVMADPEGNEFCVCDGGQPHSD